MGSAMVFLILGPVDARLDDEPVPLSGTRRRALLARLLLDRGRVVPAGVLVEDVWEGHPPTAADATLQSHISQLRKVLGGRLTSRTAGYVLELDGASLDADEFEHLQAAADASLAGGDPSAAMRLIEEALALWRGRALHEVSDRPWAAPEAARLEELRATAVDDGFKAGLQLGLHERVVAAAERAVAEEPLREQRWAHLMLALFRSGRQADALAAYDRLRKRLADELGVDPCPMLVALQVAILRQDPSLSPPAGTAAPDRAALLDAARRATEHRDWSEACRLLAEADVAGPLGAEELAWLGDTAYFASRHDLSVPARERAHTAWLAAGDPAGAAMAALGLVANHFVRGRRAIAAGWYHRARRLLQDQPEGPAHGILAATAAISALAVGDPAAALDSAVTASDIGNRTQIPDVQALGLALQGIALARLGRTAEALPYLDEALAYATAGDIGPMAVGLIYCHVLQALLDVADVERAAEWVDAGDTHAVAAGRTGGFPGDCRVHRAQILVALGRWTDAETEAQAACQAVQDFDLVHAGIAQAQLGMVRLAGGDLTGAADCFTRAHACGASAQPGLALLHLARGQAADAAASIETALADPTLGACGRATLLPSVVTIALANGDRDRAAAAVGELVGLAERFRTPGLIAVATTARGALLLADGAARDAVAVLQQACHLWRRLNAPGRLRPTRLLLADALDAAGDRTGAELERRTAGAVDGAAV